METNKNYELYIVTLSTLGLLAISLCSFSRRSRKKIHKRDHNKSAESGVGGCLQCAHINHDKKHPDYNKPFNGRLLTPREHYLDHYHNHGKNGLSKEDNFAATKGLYFTLSKDQRKGLPNFNNLKEK